MCFWGAEKQIGGLRRLIQIPRQAPQDEISMQIRLHASFSGCGDDATSSCLCATTPPHSKMFAGPLVCGEKFLDGDLRCRQC